MIAYIALAICACFIFVLYLRDRNACPMPSRSLWIPFLWILMIGTKPVSAWFGGGVDMETLADYAEGSPVDRFAFLLLLFAGLIVLARRKLNWQSVLASNPWLYILFGFWCVSMLWSSNPFVSLKRWTKDIGNIVMVLIILTEQNPVQAFKAIFTRYVYLAIPLSVVFIRYFPNLGRYYNRWTWEPLCCGISTGKNELGAVLFFSGLFLVWDLRERLVTRRQGTVKTEVFGHAILLVMLAWLIYYSRCMTALGCLLLGVPLLLWLRHPYGALRVRQLPLWALVGGLAVLAVALFPGLLGLLGRDATLTGRTDIWRIVLGQAVDVLLGAGYQDFWQRPQTSAVMWEIFGHMNQAHNGYIETYLNGGVVGLFLLLVTMFYGLKELRRRILFGGGSFPVFLLVYLSVIAVYSLTEAIFNKISLLWFVMLMACLVNVDQSDFSTNPGTLSENRLAHSDV